VTPSFRRIVPALCSGLAIAAAWLLCVPAGGAADLPTLRAEQAPYFTSDLSISRDREGRPSLVVSISVPYTELQWVKTSRGYAASVEFTVALDPSRKGRSYGGSWQRELLVATYSASRSPNSTLVERDTLRVPAGRYSLRVGFQDLQSDEHSSASDRVDVEDWSKVPVGFSELELGTGDSLSTFQPRTGRVFGREVARLSGRVTVFDRRPGGWPRRYSLVVRIRDESGNPLLEEPRTVAIAASGEPLLLRPSRTDLFIGNYSFEVELNEAKSRWKVDRSLEVEDSGPPRGAEFDRMLEPLGYIADPAEVEALQKLPPADRETGWTAFWQKRDPTPETPRNEALIDFIHRVRYSEQHFQGFGPGWRSDMGRTYIRMGPPDQIETRPASVQSPAVEIWYYNQPYRRMVFVDREGFGRFVLLPNGME
jgi:GWxTD domain-containing protein